MVRVEGVQGGQARHSPSRCDAMQWIAELQVRCSGLWAENGPWAMGAVQCCQSAKLVDCSGWKGKKPPPEGPGWGLVGGKSGRGGGWCK